MNASVECRTPVERNCDHLQVRLKFLLTRERMQAAAELSLLLWAGQEGSV